MSATYYYYKEQGICVRCKTFNVIPGKVYCKDCVDKTTIKNRERYKFRKENKLCKICGIPICKKTLCKPCAEASRKRANNNNLKLKLKIFEVYGNKCACCGEDNFYFLQIDHMDGGGTKHRKIVGTSGIYKFLKDNKYPANFQLLCSNCNWSKGIYGECPHTNNLAAPIPLHTKRTYTKRKSCTTAR